MPPVSHPSLTFNGTGNYIHKKKANGTTVEMEEILLENGLLGDCSPQTQWHTFAPRSGEEHS